MVFWRHVGRAHNPILSERVKKLEDAGVICGYSAKIDTHGSITTALVLSHPISKTITLGQL